MKSTLNVKHTIYNSYLFQQYSSVIVLSIKNGIRHRSPPSVVKVWDTELVEVLSVTVGALVRLLCPALLPGCPAFFGI